MLLGDPGAGKTTAFEAECEALGENACMSYSPRLPDLQSAVAIPNGDDKTLFIDGLDEIRVGADDARTSLVTRYAGVSTQLGKPRIFASRVGKRTGWEQMIRSPWNPSHRTPR